MSLPCQIEDCSSLPPESSWPPAVPRRTSARSRNAALELEVLVIVTVVVRSPPGPAECVVAAVTDTADCGSVCSDVRFAYVEIVPCGWPSVLLQFTTSGWVESQETFRSTNDPFWFSTSST